MNPLIPSIIFFICGVILYYKNSRIKVEKNIEQEQYKQTLQKEIHQLQLAKQNRIVAEIERTKQADEDFLAHKQQQEKSLNADYQKGKEILKIKLERAQQECSQQIEGIHKDLNKIRESAHHEKELINKILIN